MRFSSHLGRGSLACVLALAACGKSGAQGMGGADRDLLRYVSALQLLNGTFYALDDVGIRTLDVATGAATLVDSIAPTDPAYEVEMSGTSPVFDSANVYFIDPSDAAIDFFPLAQGAQPAFLEPNDMLLGSYGLGNLTTDGSQLYVSGNGFSGQGGDTFLVPPDGSDASILVPGETGVLAFTAKHVVGLEGFFDVQAYAAIWAAPRFGGSAKTLFQTTDSVLGIVADDADVYWWDITTGAIMSAPTSGGEAQVPLRRQQRPHGGSRLELLRRGTPTRSTSTRTTATSTSSRSDPCAPGAGLRALRRIHAPRRRLTHCAAILTRNGSAACRRFACGPEAGARPPLARRPPPRAGPRDNRAALAMVFVAAVACSLALHLDYAPVRRSGLRVLNNLVLDPLFQGKLVVGEIEQLDLDGATLLDVNAFDPDGVPVVHVDRLRADGEVSRIVRGVAVALLGGGDLHISVSRATSKMRRSRSIATPATMWPSGGPSCCRSMSSPRRSGVTSGSRSSASRSTTSGCTAPSRRTSRSTAR